MEHKSVIAAQFFPPPSFFLFHVILLLATLRYAAGLSADAKKCEQKCFGKL
jgi:hypothetical protein